MKTVITFPFLLADVSNALIAQIIAAAGVTGLTITSLMAQRSTLTVTANRHLTGAEKTAVAAAFAAALITLTDA